MNLAFTYALYGLSAILLVISFVKDKAKTLLALKKAWKMFINIMPTFLAVVIIASILLAVLDSETIQRLIGYETGIIGMIIAALVGAATYVPALVAFPIVAELIENGAGIMQMAVFVSALTTVALATLPLEIKYLGKKIAIMRNGLFFIGAFIVAVIVGLVL